MTSEAVVQGSTKQSAHCSFSAGARRGVPFLSRTAVPQNYSSIGREVPSRIPLPTSNFSATMNSNSNLVHRQVGTQHQSTLNTRLGGGRPISVYQGFQHYRPIHGHANKPKVTPFKPVVEDQSEDYHAYEKRYKEVNDYYRKQSNHWRFLFYVLCTGCISSAVFLVIEIKNNSMSFSSHTVYLCLSVWSATGTLVYCGFLKRADSMNIINTRMDLSLAQYALTCTTQGNIGFKQVKTVKSQPGLVGTGQRSTFTAGSRDTSK